MATQELSLAQICSIYNTDKNTYHCYVNEIYEELFKDIRLSAKNILEIGTDSGASVVMWSEYFSNANIFSVDIKECPQISNRKRIHHIVADAYMYDTLSIIPDNLDIIIDDGSHRIEDMGFVIVEYIKKLNQDGILVIEDIPDFNWVNILKRNILENYYVEIKDLRKIKNRYDDIALIIKNKL